MGGTEVVAVGEEATSREGGMTSSFGGFVLAGIGWNSVLRIFPALVAEHIAVETAVVIFVSGTLS